MPTKTCSSTPRRLKTESRRQGSEELVGWPEPLAFSRKAEVTPVLPPRTQTCLHLPRMSLSQALQMVPDPRNSQGCPSVLVNVQSSMVRRELWPPGRSVGWTPPLASLFIRDMAQGHGEESCVCVKHILRMATVLTPKGQSLTLPGHRGHF